MNHLPQFPAFTNCFDYILLLSAMDDPTQRATITNPTSVEIPSSQVNAADGRVQQAGQQELPKLQEALAKKDETTASLENRLSQATEQIGELKKIVEQFKKSLAEIQPLADEIQNLKVQNSNDMRRIVQAAPTLARGIQNLYKTLEEALRSENAKILLNRATQLEGSSLKEGQGQYLHLTNILEQSKKSLQEMQPHAEQIQNCKIQTLKERGQILHLTPALAKEIQRLYQSIDEDPQSKNDKILLNRVAQLEDLILSLAERDRQGQYEKYSLIEAHKEITKVKELKNTGIALSERLQHLEILEAELRKEIWGKKENIDGFATLDLTQRIERLEQFAARIQGMIAAGEEDVKFEVALVVIQSELPQNNAVSFHLSHVDEELKR